MADNVAITAGSGTIVKTDQVGTDHYQFMKLANGEADSATVLGVYAEDEASADADTGLLALAKRNDTPANTSGTDGDYEALQLSGGRLWVSNLGFPFAISVDVTRPANTTAYTAADAWSDSTTAPTSGGYTFAVGRKSGGSVLISDAICATSNDAATKLQIELWLFNQAVTNINDNSAFAVSDSEIKTAVGVIPFGLIDAGNNGFCHVQNLALLATCSGSANLRGLLRVRNGYTPASAEVLTVILKGYQID